MYDVATTLRYFDQNIFWILVATGFAWVGGSVQVFEALRLTHRDKMLGFPISYFCIALAHDGTFAMNYERWFTSVHHWYFTNIWFGYVFFALVEIGAILYMLPYAHREYAAKLPKAVFYGIYFLFQVTAIVLFHLLESVINDPLNIFGLVPVQLISILFIIPFLIRRGNTRGQSRIMAWALLLGPGSFGMLQSVAMLPALRTPLFYGMVACTTALSIAYILLLEYYRKLEAREAKVVAPADAQGLATV